MIDAPIRRLIEELNAAGLKTLYSCGGHETDREIWNRYITIELNDDIRLFVDKGSFSVYWRGE